MRKLALILVAVIVAAGAGYAARGYLAEVADRAHGQAVGRPAATLTDLTSIDQLKAAFEGAGGEPRLILLLSPT